MSAVKNHFHDQICAMAEPDGCEPDECEMCGGLFSGLTDGVCSGCALDYEDGQFEDLERF